MSDSRKPAPPKPRLPSQLQKQFDKLTKGGGLFGLFGSKKPQKEDDTLAVQVAQMILEEGVRSRASDVHIEPLLDRIQVRYRVDGLLEEALSIPGELRLRVISRIRVLCGLDPEQSTSTSKPEDGRMGLRVDDKDVDMRLSTFPTIYGDKAVLRLMDRTTNVPELGRLGLKNETLLKVRRVINRPQGMVIVTGPAGSGKSTTLYSVLQAIQDPSRNIVTLEDPVEMKIRGISQSAVHHKAGFDFAGGLRAILRQDPNVIMVGEIRDRETVEIAMSASLTGHLLFTTLHTTSAVGAVTRLLDMGIEPFLINSALTAVFAQRLARRICPKCRSAYEPGPEVLKQLGEIAKQANTSLPPGKSAQLYTGKGCEACRGTGYHGRTLIFEMLPITAALRRLVLQKASTAELQAQAQREGLESMLADGLHQAVTGKTTLAEVLRVVGLGD